MAASFAQALSPVFGELGFFLGVARGSCGCRDTASGAGFCVTDFSTFRWSGRGNGLSRVRIHDEFGGHRKRELLTFICQRKRNMKSLEDDEEGSFCALLTVPTRSLHRPTYIF